MPPVAGTGPGPFGDRWSAWRGKMAAGYHARETKLGREVAQARTSSGRRVWVTTATRGASEWPRAARSGAWKQRMEYGIVHGDLKAHATESDTIMGTADHLPLE